MGQVPSNYHSEIQRSKDVLYITVCNHVISALLGLSIMKVYNTHVLAVSRSIFQSAGGYSSSSMPPVTGGWLLCVLMGQSEPPNGTNFNRLASARILGVCTMRWNTPDTAPPFGTCHRTIKELFYLVLFGPPENIN